MNNNEQYKRYTMRRMETALMKKVKVLAVNTERTQEAIVNEALRIGLPAIETQERVLAQRNGRRWWDGNDK